VKSKEQKRTEARERQKRRDKRTLMDQLGELDRRLGFGKGATEERFRITTTALKACE
jgi:hypothetical protein